jgi:DNA-binding LacI/PurR family transcriptional regulator
MVQRGHREVMAASFVPSIVTHLIHQDLAEFASVHDLGDPTRMLLEVPSDGYRWDHKFIARALDRDPRPTGIVVADEFLAADLFRACYERHIRVPDDLSVASVFNCAPHMHPIRLTSTDTIHVRSLAAELAAKHLVKEMQGERSQVSRVKLRSDIEWTESVRDLTGGDGAGMARAAQQLTPAMAG